MEQRLQYNRTALQQLQKQLTIRLRALPTLKSKETALRLEVKNVSKKLENMEAKWAEIRSKQAEWEPFWETLPDIFLPAQTEIDIVNVASVKVPVLRSVKVRVAPYSLYSAPAETPHAVQALKERFQAELEVKVCRQQLALLQLARKRTTQKVNLYEKVQIPAIQDSMLKIKRFLEDKENIEKAAQKIVKKRLSQAEELANTGGAI